MTRSRKNYRLEKETKRNLYLILGGVAILLLIIFTVGSNLLVNISLFVENDPNISQATDTKTSVVAQPNIDPLPRATNSAQLTISGSAYSGNNVLLYINGKNTKKTKIEQDGTFIFENVELENGDNTIKAKALTKDNEESKFSSVITVHFSTQAPDLEISSPQEGDAVNKDRNPIQVNGKTSIDTNVTVNGFRATTDDQGNFSYRLSLRPGENIITVISTTKAGNRIEKQIKVSYSE